MGMNMPSMTYMYTQMFGVCPCFNIMPYEVDNDGTTKYWRYTAGKAVSLRGEEKAAKDIIYRETKDGNITRTEKAFDFWENRTSAEYFPVNSPFDETGAATPM